MKARKMNKKKITIGVLGAIFAIYAIGAMVFTLKILPNTTFSDHEVAMISKGSLAKDLKALFEDQTIEINDEVIVDYAPKYVDLGASIDSEKLAADIKLRQNPWKWPVALFQDQDYNLSNYITVDTGKLNGKLVTDKLLSNSERTDATNAKMFFDDLSGEYAVEKEKPGTILGDDFKEALAASIINGDSSFDATAFYIAPEIVSSDFDNDLKMLNSRLNRALKVTFGDKEYEIPKKDIETFIFINDEDEFDVDNTVLHNYLSQLALDYNNVSTSSGTRVATSYDIENAYYQIESGLLSEENNDIVGKTTVQTSNQRSGQTSTPSSSTYIEISISQQYMWVYNNGNLVVGTHIVTGNVANGWNTPTGTYTVWNKETNKVLNGASVGFEYEVPVNYWMAINYTGIGIHDIAYLNSTNAPTYKDRYKTNGSHGCINTPNDLMATVYNNTPLGTPVYVMP